MQWFRCLSYSSKNRSNDTTNAKCLFSLLVVPPKILDKKHLENKTENIKLVIEKGMCDQEQILFKGKGNFNLKTMENNDLVFVLIEQEHPLFKRMQNNLILGLDINLSDSLTGFSFLFKHLDDTEFIISSEEIIKNEEVKVVKIKGCPLILHLMFSVI